MKRAAFLVFAALCLVSLGAVRASDESNDTILQWHSMAAVQSPYFSISVPFTPIDGVGGGNARWIIDKGWGHLKANGELRVHTRGLILPDPPFNGQNVVPFFRVLIKCRSVDANGAANLVETFTENYPADTAGNSDLITNVSLPSPCYAPSIFVMHFAAPRWFATTGSN